MAKRVSLSFKETGVDAITQGGRVRLSRVQRAEVSANLPNTNVQELGSNKYVGRLFDLPEVTATVSAMDVGARNVFTLAGRDWASAPSGTYVEAQDIQYVCLAQTFKSQGSDDIARTLWIPGSKLERFSLNYSVGGDATEEFSFNSTNRRWLKYDVAVASGSVTASGTLAFTPAARQLKDGRYVLSAFASGTGYLPMETITASTANSVTFDSNVAPGTPVVVAYHTDLSNQWDYTYEYPNVAPGYTPTPDQPVGVRGFGVEVYLTKSGQTNNRVYRAQTVTLQGQYPNTRVNELGSEEVVGYMDGIPDVTGTIEILTHDFRLHELLSGDVNGTEDNFDPNELGTGDWGLLIKIYRRGVDRAVFGPEKTVYVPMLDVTQDQNSSQVGQDHRETYNIASRTGEVYFYKGNFNPWA